MTNGTYLTRESIVGASDLQYEDVSVPEWGGTVRVREMTAADRETFMDVYSSREDAKAAGEHPPSIQASLAALCMVDADGNRLFDDDQVKQLEAKSSRALMRVYDVAMRLCALRRTDVEELKKNSDTSTSAGSATA